jgi:3-oxoacyl-[acyl-carrier-protein] synthase II
MKTTIYDAMEHALENSALTPAEIDYICACAPGDPVIDRVETTAIKDLFKRRAYSVPISSIKSMIGNPGAAAGPLQAITAAMSIRNNFVPPTINLEKPGKSCDLDYVPGTGRTARVNRALVNVRGFGGGISSLVLSSAT